MKSRFLLLVLFTISGLLLMAQPSIPNASFEEWSNSGPLARPNGWTTNENAITPDVVQQSADAHTGTASVLLGVKSYNSILLGGALSTNFSIVPLDPANFHVWLKMNLASGDVFSINATGSSNGIVVCNGGLQYSDIINIGAWTHVSFQMSDVSIGPSDSIHINFSFQNATDTQSFVMLDDVSFDDGATSTHEIVLENGTGIENIYPNPSNQTGNLIYQLSGPALISLDVIDVLGNKVQHLFSERQNPGRYRAEIATASLPSGIYVAILNVDGQNIQHQFIVQH